MSSFSASFEDLDNLLKRRKKLAPLLEALESRLQSLFPG
jgi:hypothetical protein